MRSPPTDRVVGGLGRGELVGERGGMSSEKGACAGGGTPNGGVKCAHGGGGLFFILM